MALMKNIAASRGWKGFDFHISQADINNLNQKLEGLNEDVKKRILTKALRAGGKIFIIEAKQRVMSDRVYEGIRGMTRTVRGVKGYIAGPSKGFPNPAWLEYGTMDQYVGRGRGGKSYIVKRTKSIQGADGNWYTLRAGRRMTKGQRRRPFIQPAFDTKYPAVINKIGDVIKVEVLKHGK